MGPEVKEVEVGMPIGAALPGDKVDYVSSNPSSPMACGVRNELGVQGKCVEVQGPQVSPNLNAFNMASSNLSVSAAPAPAPVPAPAPQVSQTFSA
ncbi:MAG: hypothetical protein KBC88_06035 [Alphaproteobacteria bacterium]|jgi:hypothetical protein|nr:hypothetical protein [Alphaproteobacteria bacterium]